MRRQILIVFMIFHSANGFAQELIHLNGKVVDRKTQRPLTYAGLGVVGRPIGTVTNSNGEFEFNISPTMAEDSLFISFLGYGTFKEKISNLVKNQTKHFELSEVVILLNEVTVESNKITAKGMVEDAIKALPVLLSEEPYLMEGFYRSWERIEFVDSTTYPGTLCEAALSIYEPGYDAKAKKANEEVYISEIRRSSLKEIWDYRYNYLLNILGNEEVRYSQLGPHFNLLPRFAKLPNTLQYEFDGATRIDDEELVIVKVTATNTRNLPAYYRIYINPEDYAILRYELHGKKDQTNYNFEYGLEDLEHVYIFMRYDKKLFLNYAKVRWTTEKVDRAEKKVKQHEHYFSELLITHIVTSNVNELRQQLGKKAKSNVSMEAQAGAYNEAFWKTYNIIKKNPLDKEIISYFEQEDKLENQYRMTGKESKKKVMENEKKQ